ncbi:MAG: hypothetical protein HYX37_08185 [Rhizobiales bacterium]|nr:hypothetical protein [Hyphomicrobiales bacterium]
MKAKPFIVSFLAVVAVLAAVSVYIGATVDKAAKSIAVVVSPDGKYKAVKVTMASGGTSPFCFDSVSVVFAAYPDSFAERDKPYEIYSGPCGSFANGEPSPKIEWLSGTALQITYANNPAKKPKLKTIDVTKTVHVTFVAR